MPVIGNSDNTNEKPHRIRVKSMVNTYLITRYLRLFESLAPNCTNSSSVGDSGYLSQQQSQLTIIVGAGKQRIVEIGTDLPFSTFIYLMPV